MTDFDREADLLSEYMGYWIDHLTDEMFWPLTPKKLVETYMVTGMFFYYGDQGRTAMTFEQWKEHNGHNKVQQNG